MKDQREEFLEYINGAPLPTLGDTRKQYRIVIDEPECNALAGAIAFVKSACSAAGMNRYWEHYGPTLEAFAKRIGREIPDDDNAPYQESA